MRFDHATNDAAAPRRRDTPSLLPARSGEACTRLGLASGIAPLAGGRALVSGFSDQLGDGVGRLALSQDCTPSAIRGAGRRSARRPPDSPASSWRARSTELVSSTATTALPLVYCRWSGPGAWEDCGRGHHALSCDGSFSESSRAVTGLSRRSGGLDAMRAVPRWWPPRRRGRPAAAGSAPAAGPHCPL